MPNIKITDAAYRILEDKKITAKPLLLITNDAGGQYSSMGGACSIGSNFSIIILDKSDPEYAVPLENQQGLTLCTSDYDLLFLGQGIILDYQQSRLILRNDGGLLDTSVAIETVDAVRTKITGGTQGC